MEAPQPGDIPAAQFSPDAPAAQPPQETPQTGDIPANEFVSDEDKYSGLGGSLKAGAQGALKGLLGPLAPPAEKLAGVSYATQRGLTAAHPVISGAGEASTLIGGALLGTGEAALLSKAGEAAASIAGLAKPMTYAAKVGSSAIKQAVEMAVYQSGDEVSKQILQDPDAAAGNAMAHIGLAAALGGAGGTFVTGAISPLWKATVGPTVENGLRAIVGHLGGTEGEAVKSTADALAKQAKVEIAPEVGAVIDDTPGARALHSELSQNDRMAGRAYQGKLQNLDDQMTARTVEALGRPVEGVESIPQVDKYTAGKVAGETLAQELEPKIKDVTDRYEANTDRFKGSELSQDLKRSVSEKLGQAALDGGWAKAVDNDNMRLVQKTLDKLPEQATIEDLKKMSTNLWRAHDAPDLQAATATRKILNSSIEDAITEAMSRQGTPEQAARAVSDYAQLRKDYSALSDHLDNLDEHLKVGKYSGPQSFLTALKDMSVQHGERLADRMLGTRAANVLEVLKATPKTLELAKQNHIDNLLRAAVERPGVGRKINTRRLVQSINNLTPQVQQLVMTPEQKSVVEGVASIQKALEDPTHNWSNTARTAENKAHGTISPISMIAMLMGHGGAGVLSFLSSLGLSEARPALKLGMLKMMATDTPVSGTGFKSMVSFVSAAQKGAKVIDVASKNVLKPGSKVLVDSLMPSQSDIMKLDKLVAKNQEDPNALQQSQSDSLGHYMGDHQTAMTAATVKSLQYLQNLKPKPQQLGPLDTPIEPSEADVARYHRALEIAQQPAVVLQRVKDGSVQLSDIQDLQATNPSAYKQMSQTITNAMVDRKADDAPIPYKTRVGVSLFLGQPMDTSMSPMSIQAAQPQPKPMPQPQGKTKRGTSTLGKSSKSYSTPGQAAEADSADRD